MLRLAGLLLFLLLLAIIASAFLNPFPQVDKGEFSTIRRDRDSNSKVKYGVSYSFEQAAWYGLDPKKAYISLLDEVRPDWVRLPFFWNHPSIYSGQKDLDAVGNISDLKWAIDEANKKNVRVVVSLGAKTPYYPEYHWPDEVAAKVRFGEKIGVDSPVASDILDIERKVVGGLQGFDNIAYWQVENEPYLANVNNWKIDENLLKAEVEVVRITDSKGRPIILNHVAPAVFDKQYKSLLAILKPGDVFGVNAYFKTQGTYLESFKILGQEIHIRWPDWLVWPVQSWSGFSPDFSALKKEIERKGIRLWVLEMQAEPYVRTLEDAKSREFFYEASDIVKADAYLRSNQIEAIGLWGAPFWLYRQKNGDDSWMETTREIMGRF